MEGARAIYTDYNAVSGVVWAQTMVVIAVVIVVVIAVVSIVMAMIIMIVDTRLYANNVVRALMMACGGSVHVCLGPLITLRDANVKDRSRRQAITITITMSITITISPCTRGHVGRATDEDAGWIGAFDNCISEEILGYRHKNHAPIDTRTKA